MSAVRSDHIQTGEQSRVETDDQEAGTLQPQTVFVILDSAETLNLVRWVSVCLRYRGQGWDPEFVSVNLGFHS